MKTLIKMTDYVKEQGEIGMEIQSISHQQLFRVNRFNKMVKYANFISLTPEIWMFVACDSEGNVLEEPTDEKLCKYCPIEEDKRHVSAHSIGCEGSRCDVAYENYEEEYQQAKERCYFDGWEYDGAEDGFIYLKKDDTLLIFDAENKTLMLSNNSEEFNISTIEDLIPYNLPLTATAQKEIV
jgi:hypothetical protein